MGVSELDRSAKTGGLCEVAWSHLIPANSEKQQGFTVLLERNHFSVLL